MPTEVLFLAVALLLSAPLLWLWTERQRLHRERSEQDLALDDQRRALQALGQEKLSAQQEVLTLRQQADVLQRSLADARSLERRAVRLDEERRDLLVRTERQDAQLRSVHEQLQLVTRGAGRHQEQAAALQQDTDRLREAAARYSRRYQRASMALSLLGWRSWEAEAPVRDALSPDERALSQAVLDRLGARPEIEDVVLASRAGTALLGAGEPAMVDRLAAFGALAAGLWQGLGELMQQEVVLLSLSSVARGLHITPAGERWLLVHGDPAPLTHDIFYTRMSLTGSVGGADAPASAALSTSRGENVALRRRLQAWASTHGGMEVALYTERGAVLAATGAGAPRLTALLERWPAWALRLAWMGWTAEALTLRAQGFQQGCLTLRILPADSGAAVLLLWGTAEPAPDALDDFLQKLRWDHLRAAGTPAAPEEHLHG